MKFNKYALIFASISLTNHCAVIDPILETVKQRSWSESSIPIILIGGFIVSAAIGYMQISPGLSGNALSVARADAFYSYLMSSTIFIFVAKIFYWYESSIDAVYYIKTNKPEMIARVERSSKPDKPQYRNDQFSAAWCCLIIFVWQYLCRHGISYLAA